LFFEKLKSLYWSKVAAKITPIFVKVLPIELVNCKNTGIFVKVLQIEQVTCKSTVRIL